MKKILHSAALLIMTASVIWAAVISPHPAHEKCSREREKEFKKKEQEPAADSKDSNLNNDIFFMNHSGIN